MSEYHVDYGEPISPDDHVWREVKNALEQISAEVTAVIRAKSGAETRSRPRKKTPDDSSSPATRRGKNYVSPDEADEMVDQYEREKANERWPNLEALIQRIKTFVKEKLSGKLSDDAIQSAATGINVDVVQIPDSTASDQAFAGLSERVEKQWNAIKKELGMWSDDSTPVEE